MLYQLRNKLVGPKNLDNFEKKFVLYASLVFSVSGLFGVLLNSFLGLGNTMVLVALGTFITYLVIYLAGRFTSLLNSLKWVISLVSIALINIFWLYNYNSHGPVLYLFVVYFSMLLFIWDIKPVIILFLLILTNIIVLYVVEYSNPEILPGYPDERARITDTYSGLIIYFSIIFIFTTAAKNNYIHQYKRAKESDKLKSAFLQNLSHEIRTPLNAIVGFSNLVFSAQITVADKKKYKALVEANNEHLIRLIDDMIDLSMIETNQFALKDKLISINGILNQEYEIFQHILRKEGKAIDLRVMLLPDDVKIKTDATRLEQILNNLLANATKFTNHGGVSFGCVLKNNDAEFFVSDTGIGIKPENTEQIFQRFTKIADANTTIYRGLGLGLFLTRRLVTILGGRIWVESDYGKGSTFYFSIPLKKA